MFGFAHFIFDIGSFHQLMFFQMLIKIITESHLPRDRCRTVDPKRSAQTVCSHEHFHMVGVLNGIADDGFRIRLRSFIHIAKPITLIGEDAQQRDQYKNGNMSNWKFHDTNIDKKSV